LVEIKKSPQRRLKLDGKIVSIQLPSRGNKKISAKEIETPKADRRQAETTLVEIKKSPQRRLKPPDLFGGHTMFP